MNNKRMEEMIKSGLAVDLSKCSMDEATGRFYVIDNPAILGRLAGDIETYFCDSNTEQWIWSIGRAIDGKSIFKAGTVLASTTGTFYQNPSFECLWLR